VVLRDGSPRDCFSNAVPLKVIDKVFGPPSPSLPPPLKRASKSGSTESWEHHHHKKEATERNSVNDIEYKPYACMSSLATASGR